MGRIQLLVGDHAGGACCIFETLIRALVRSQLGFARNALIFSAQHFRLRLGLLRHNLRCRKHGNQLPPMNNRAAIHADGFHKSAHARKYAHLLIRLQFPGQVNHQIQLARAHLHRLHEHRRIALHRRRRRSALGTASCKQRCGSYSGGQHNNSHSGDFLRLHLPNPTFMLHTNLSFCFTAGHTDCAHPSRQAKPNVLRPSPAPLRR